jgi:hypothetical protein
VPSSKPEGRSGAARLVRGVPDCGCDDPGSQTSAGVVLAEVASNLPLRGRPALPSPAPDPDQLRPLARRGGVVNDQQERIILAGHVRGQRGMGAGCQAWARLTPYPCSQVEWATIRQAGTITARFCGVCGDHPRPGTAALELRRLPRPLALPDAETRSTGGVRRRPGFAGPLPRLLPRPGRRRLGLDSRGHAAPPLPRLDRRGGPNGTSSTAANYGNRASHTSPRRAGAARLTSDGA